MIVNSMDPTNHLNHTTDIDLLLLLLLLTRWGSDAKGLRKSLVLRPVMTGDDDDDNIILGDLISLVLDLLYETADAA